MSTFSKSVGRFARSFLICSGMAAASVIPQSSCTFNQVGGVDSAGGFTCDLYPSNPSGGLNDINIGISFPTGYDASLDPLTPGYLIILEPGLDPNDIAIEQNLSNWLQVVEFAPVDGPPFNSTSINLYTLGCNNLADPNDTSCFPSFDAVNSVSNFFDSEPVSTPAFSAPYDYALDDPKGHEYFIHFAAETVPEPASIATFGAGLLVIGFFGRRRFLRDRDQS